MPAINPIVVVNKTSGLGRWLLKVAAEIGSLVLTDLYTDGVGQVATTEPIEWRRLTFRYQRTTPTGTDEDFAMWHLDVVNMTGGNLDSSWTAGDYTNVDAAVTELANGIMSRTSATHTLVDVQYHRRAFSLQPIWGETVPQYQETPPGEKQKEVSRFEKTGPPLHIKTLGLIGSVATTALPYQSAMSVTLKTAAPKHWGRIYLPGLHSGEFSQHGRFDTGTMTAIANLFAEFASDLGANDFFLKVAMTQHDSIYRSALSAVESIVVDDVPDVIRRRRPKQAAARVVGVPTP